MRAVLYTCIGLTIISLLVSVLFFTAGYAANKGSNSKYDKTICTLNSTYVEKCRLTIHKTIPYCFNGILEYSYPVFPKGGNATTEYGNTTATIQLTYNATVQILDTYKIGSNVSCYYNSHDFSDFRFGLLPTNQFLVAAGFFLVVAFILFGVTLVINYNNCGYERINDLERDGIRYYDEENIRGY